MWNWKEKRDQKKLSHQHNVHTANQAVRCCKGTRGRGLDTLLLAWLPVSSRYMALQSCCYHLPLSFAPFSWLLKLYTLREEVELNQFYTLYIDVFSKKEEKFVYKEDKVIGKFWKKVLSRSSTNRLPMALRHILVRSTQRLWVVAAFSTLMAV